MSQFHARLPVASTASQSSRRIYEMLKAQMTDGSCPAGFRLPSTRSLASDLGVSRTTITAIYEQLAAEGYVETSKGTRARVAAGVVVTVSTRASKASRSRGAVRLSAYGRRVAEIALPSMPPAAPSRPIIEFLYGALSFEDFPTLAWRRAYDRALLHRQSRLYYSTPEGELELRAELQGYLRRARGLVCDPDQIIITHGSQQAIDLCARVLVDPGDPVLIEEPCYLMARRVFEAAGAKIFASPVDEHGLVTHDLPTGRTTLAYVTPSHQFPLGGVMPIARRQELLSWAQRSGAWLIEDDYDGEFRYGLRPVDALQSIDEAGSVIYVGTFSKALTPQMRLGYLVLPKSLVSVFRHAKRLTDRHAPLLEQLALASFIRSGAYERHVRRVRRENERRRAVLLQAVGQYLPAETQIEGAASGLHVVMWLTQLRSRDEETLVVQAREHGVAVWPISPTYAAGGIYRKRKCAGLVIGYASLNPTEIEKGMARLGAVVKQMGSRNP